MPTGRSPSLRQRRLAAALRRFRASRDRTLEQVAVELDWSTAKISRIETGRVRVAPRDVERLLDCYDVQGDERVEVIRLAREAGKRGWWQAYSDGLPKGYVTYLGFEDEACSMRSYCAQVVPGLLQTEAYAREVIRSALVVMPPSEIDRRVEVRMARQSVLLREDPLRLWSIIDEAVLTRQVGDAEVMREQLHRLLELAEVPCVTLQMLPFAAGAHPATACSFEILEFPERADPDVAYLENLSGSLYIEDERDVLWYTVAFDYLRAKACDPDETVRWLKRSAERL